MNHRCGVSVMPMLSILRLLTKKHAYNAYKYYELELWYDKFNTYREPIYEDEYREYGGSPFCTVCYQPVQRIKS